MGGRRLEDVKSDGNAGILDQRHLIGTFPKPVRKKRAAGIEFGGKAARPPERIRASVRTIPFYSNMRMDIMTELPPLLPEYLEPVRALFEKPRVKQAMKLLDDGAEAAMVMQCELCEIPAPTFHEEVRAAEIVRRMKALGL